MLLAGYFYVDRTTRHLTAKRQTGAHLVLIVIALLFLPIIPDISWKPTGDEYPGLRIQQYLISVVFVVPMWRDR